MKKVIGLLCAVTFSTDLFASAIISESTGLSPKTLTQLEIVTEQQVSEMYSQWCELTNKRDEAFKKYEALREKTSNPEELATALAKYNALFEREKQYLYEEIEVISRVPNEMEQYAISKLLKALPAGIVDEVKIVDTESFVRGLYLNKDQQDELILHLNNDDAIEWLLDTLQKLVTFEDETLKAQVLNLVREGCESSPVFYRQMISYIARMAALPSICARFYYSESYDKNEIYRKGYSSSAYGMISIGTCEDTEYTPSHFGLPGMRPRLSGIFPFTLKLAHIVFHESGHSSDFFSNTFEHYHLAETIDSIAPLFFNMSLNKEVFKQQCEKLKKSIKELPEFLLEASQIHKRNFSDLDSYMQFLEDNLDDKQTQAQMFFDHNIEMWQIFGILLLNEGAKKVLYINKNSDVTLCVSESLPFRANHGAQSELFPDEAPLFSFKMPEIYKPLVEALTDTTWGGYITRLTYPNGLLSGLQREYDLYKSEMH